MKTFLLSITCVGLTIFDAYFTTKRMNEIGNDVELNPVVRGIAKRLGATTGSLLGIVAPQALLILLLADFHLDLALSFILGMRTFLTIKQLASRNL
jgi:hypothetical protein